MNNKQNLTYIKTLDTTIYENVAPPDHSTNATNNRFA